MRMCVCMYGDACACARARVRVHLRVRVRLCAHVCVCVSRAAMCCAACLPSVWRCAKWDVAVGDCGDERQGPKGPVTLRLHLDSPACSPRVRTMMLMMLMLLMTTGTCNGALGIVDILTCNWLVGKRPHTQYVWQY